MKQNKSIIYVNFAPYDNAGRILDYLKEQFPVVILFSFDFHRLNKRSQSNYLKVFQNGREMQETKLFKLPTPEAILFISLPFITVLIGIQMLWYILKLKRRFGQFDIYLTVNAFTAWVGNILRSLKVVQRTIFWVWDYYPPGFPNWNIRLARWAYWKFDKISSTSSDSTVFLNKRLIELRQQIGVLSTKKKYPIVSIGTNIGSISLAKKNIIGHLGVLKRSQGLDLLFDNLETLIRRIPDLKIEIIGSGPDENHFKSRAKRFQQVNFFGLVKDDNAVDKIIRNWSLGIATYLPDISNAAYWTDPSKIKAYISQGVPVVTTSITPFSEEIKKSGAGVIVDYFDSQEFVDGVFTILQSQKKFKNRAYKFSKQYYYKDIYPRLFYFK